MNSVKTFAVWFSLGAGLLVSGFWCIHVLEVFTHNNLWWWEHSTDMLALFAVSGGLFVGIFAIGVLHLTHPNIPPANALELHEFVSQSLEQTLSGIRSANDKTTEGKPIDEAPKPFLLQHGASKEKGTGIEFDIAVTTKSQAGAGGKGKLSIYVADAEIHKAGSVAREQVSRIKFTVFVNQWRG